MYRWRSHFFTLSSLGVKGVMELSQMYRWRSHFFTLSSLGVKGVMELSQMYRWRSHFFTFSLFHSFTFNGAAISSPFHLFTFNGAAIFSPFHFFTFSPFVYSSSIASQKSLSSFITLKTLSSCRPSPHSYMYSVSCVPLIKMIVGEPLRLST